MSESSEKPPINTSPEMEAETGEEEFRVNIENEIYNLSLNNAQIEAGLQSVDDDPTIGEEEKVEQIVVVDGWGIQQDTENHANDGWVIQEEDTTVNQVILNDGWGKEANESNNNVQENENGNEESVGDYSEEGKVERLDNNYNNNRRKTNYPMRPGADDCTYYMKFGTCKFGLNCKFNHPPRRKNQDIKEKVKPTEENFERTGQTECKYHMSPGGCKFGNECKFNHGSDSSSISHNPELNFLGLPIRLGEKECPYYMRTGSCKYGSSCRFHHPEPTTVGGSDAGHGNGGSLLPPQSHPSSSLSSSLRAFSGTSSLPPVMFSPPQGVALPNPEWNGYQAGTYQTSERGLPTPPAFAMKNLPTQINLPLPHHLCMVVDEYPERPGEPECSFFLKNGDCKYKSSCKYHHPKNRKAKAKSNSHSLSEKGLPHRPGQPICAHYHQYGICKYGPACKYDHPSNIGVSPTPFS